MLCYIKIKSVVNVVAEFLCCTVLAAQLIVTVSAASATTVCPSSVRSSVCRTCDSLVNGSIKICFAPYHKMMSLAPEAKFRNPECVKGWLVNNENVANTPRYLSNSAI